MTGSNSDADYHIGDAAAGHLAGYRNRRYVAAAWALKQDYKNGAQTLTTLPTLSNNLGGTRR
jgi:hypothetical protein